MKKIKWALIGVGIAVLVVAGYVTAIFLWQMFSLANGWIG